MYGARFFCFNFFFGPDLKFKGPIKGLTWFFKNQVDLIPGRKKVPVQYTKKDITIFDPDGVPLLRGWRDPDNELWRIAIVSDKEQQPPSSNH